VRTGTDGGLRDCGSRIRPVLCAQSKGDLRDAIIDGLKTARRLRLDQIRDRAAKGWGMNIRGGAGAWVGLFFADTGRPFGGGADPVSVRGYFRCETWVSAAEARQSIIEPDDRLGDRWLRPAVGII
jgi:hypothetical protein